MAKLYFRHGTMGSAKTLNLLAVAHNYRAQGKRVLVIKPRLDDRFGANIVASRAGLRAEADLMVERDNATESAKAAQRAQLRAEESARLAEKAHADALTQRDIAFKATERAETLYAKEHDRAERLEKEIGKTITVLRK